MTLCSDFHMKFSYSYILKIIGRLWKSQCLKKLKLKVRFGLKFNPKMIFCTFFANGCWETFSYFNGTNFRGQKLSRISRILAIFAKVYSAEYFVRTHSRKLIPAKFVVFINSRKLIPVQKTQNWGFLILGILWTILVSLGPKLTILWNFRSH